MIPLWVSDGTFAATIAANPTWTDAQVAAYLQGLTVPNTAQVFGSFRTLAGILTATEYNTLRTALVSAAAAEKTAGGYLINDMIGLLATPGDAVGNGGGINFQDPNFIAELTALCTAASLPNVVGEVAAYCATMAPPLPKYSDNIQPGNVTCARAGGYTS